MYGEVALGIKWMFGQETGYFCTCSFLEGGANILSGKNSTRVPAKQHINIIKLSIFVVSS